MFKRNQISQAVALAVASGAFSVPQSSLAQDDGLRIEEVIVTATRRETTLQDAAVTVSVLGSEEIDALNINSFQDYLKYSPNASSVIVPLPCPQDPNCVRR